MFAIVLEICILHWNSLGNTFGGKTKDCVTRPVEEYAADGPIKKLLFFPGVYYTLYFSAI